MHYLWRTKRYKVYPGIIYFDIIVFSSLSSSKSFVKFLNIFLLRRLKAFIRFHEEKSWNHKHGVRFPKYLSSRLNFRKLRHGFVNERAMITTTLMSSCDWKTLVTFCLQKKIWEYIFKNIFWKIKKCPF